MFSNLFSFLIALVSFWSVSVYSAVEPANVLETKQSVIDRVKVKYWGNYSGPQVANPGSKYTTDYWGRTNKTSQNADDLLTAGFQVTPTLRPGVGMPFNFISTVNTAIQIKPLYFGIIDAELYKTDELSVHSDFRIYVPVGEMAGVWDVQTGFRTSQFSTYNIPKTNFTLGLSNYVRYWKYGDKVVKAYRNDFEIYASPFVNYKISKSFVATLWCDALQLGHQAGTPFALINLPLDIQPGVKWIVNDSLSLNPYLNFIPGHLSKDNIALGMVVLATLL